MFSRKLIKTIGWYITVTNTETQGCKAHIYKKKTFI